MGGSRPTFGARAKRTWAAPPRDGLWNDMTYGRWPSSVAITAIAEAPEVVPDHL